jgi:hypothetical protein
VDAAEGVTARGVALALVMVVLITGMTQAMTIRALAADVGGSSPPVAPTYLLFLWALAAGSLPAGLRKRLRLSRGDVVLGYCAAMISGPIVHQYAIGFLIPHMVSAYYFDAGWRVFYEWLPVWFGPRDPAVVNAFFVGADGSVPWGAWLVPALAWTVLLAAFFLTGHCAMILLRRQWIDSERLAFPLAQIPLGLTTAGPDGRPPLLRAPLFWAAFWIALALGLSQTVHRYSPSIPEVPMKPAVRIDFKTIASPPWTGLGLMELEFSPWLTGIVTLLPTEISLSCWVFFLLTKVEDTSAVYFGATDVPDVYSNHYPALYAQGAGAAFAMCGAALWGARRHLRRMARAAVQGEKRQDDAGSEFGSARFAIFGLLGSLALIVGWLWLAGMRVWVAGLLVVLILSYFLVFARIRGEAGLGMGVILWPKMVNEVMITVLGTRGLSPADLTVLCGIRWLYFGPSIGGVMACQLESFKIAGEAGLRGRAAGRVLLLAALVAVPLAFAWTLHTYYSQGFLAMPIGHRTRSMVGSQVYWTYANLADALENPTGTDWGGVLAMSVGAAVSLALAALRSRFLWWPLHPVGYMAANSWGMHLNWPSFLLGWLLKALLLRYGGLRAFRSAVPFCIGLVVGDMLGEGLSGAFASFIALQPG